MANKEQLKILKQGVKAWNTWREEHPDAKIDLRGAKLDGLNLSGVNFRKADVRGVSFRNTVLVHADFMRSKTGNTLSVMGMLPLLLLIIGGVISVLLFVAAFSLYGDFLISLEINYGITRITIDRYFFSFLVGLSLFLSGLSILSIRKRKGMIIVIVSVFVTIFLISTLFWSVQGDLLIDFCGDLRSLYEDIKQADNLDYLYFYSFYVYKEGDIIFAAIFAINVVIICLYICWRTRYEDPQFALLRNLGIYLSTLFSTDFRAANLTNAIFNQAQLKHSRFGKAILTGTSFRDCQCLQFVHCNGTILNDRDVRELLVHGKGEGQSFKGKNFSGAYLVKADLRNIDLRETDLKQVNLSGADITGTKLYGSARENWIIDGIRCDYVYWDEAGQERAPMDRVFRPGEFEELYKQLPTFEYIFEQGFTPLDPLIMSRVVQAINEKHEDFLLDLVNFDKRGQPHATFTVCRLDYIDEARGQLAVLYERTIDYLTRENEDKKKRIDKLEDDVDQLIGKFSPLKELPMGNNIYNNYGQVAAMGEHASATGNTFQQIVSDLSQLHEEMRKKAATPEQQAATQDVAKAEQAAQQGDEPTMQQHLKNAGQWAVECAQKFGTDVLTEYLKKLTLGM